MEPPEWTSPSKLWSTSRWVILSYLGGGNGHSDSSIFVVFLSPSRIISIRQSTAASFQILSDSSSTGRSSYWWRDHELCTEAYPRRRDLSTWFALHLICLPTLLSLSLPASHRDGVWKSRGIAPGILTHHLWLEARNLSTWLGLIASLNAQQLHPEDEGGMLFPSSWSSKLSYDAVTRPFLSGKYWLWCPWSGRGQFVGDEVRRAGRPRSRSLAVRRSVRPWRSGLLLPHTPQAIPRPQKINSVTQMSFVLPTLRRYQCLRYAVS
jgi:hypothetical protein